MARLVPAFLQQLLARELARGERVVWLAQPAPFDMALDSAGRFLFGIPFFAFAVFWMMGATGHVPGTTSDVALPLAYSFGSIFVLVGAWLLLSPVWAWWVARRTLYAVTDQRAILIAVPLRRVNVQSFTGHTLAAAVRREGRTGRGDLIFEREASKGPKGRTVYRDVGFLAIESVRDVQLLLPAHSGPTEAAVRRAFGARDA